MDCNEIYYELIGSIEAYKDESVTFGRPFGVEQKGTPLDVNFSASGKRVIPMKRKSGSIKEDVSVSLSGEEYTVTLNWQIEEVSLDTYRMLEELKISTNHLVVRTFPDGKMFIRNIPGSDSFEYHEDRGVLTCTWIIHNLTGVQRML